MPSSGAPLNDISKQPATPAEILSKHRIPQGTSREAASDALVQADAKRNLRQVRPLVHGFLGSFPLGAKSLGQCRTHVFESILKTSLSDPMHGLGSILIPGTPKIR